MAPNTEIRELTVEAPLRKGEIALSEQERQDLIPMNRQQRRAWARAHKHRKQR